MSAANLCYFNFQVSRLSAISHLCLARTHIGSVHDMKIVNNFILRLLNPVSKIWLNSKMMRGSDLQLTSLRLTPNTLCSLLHDMLKAELQRKQMKALKALVTQSCCYRPSCRWQIASERELDQQGETWRAAEGVSDVS